MMRFRKVIFVFAAIFLPAAIPFPALAADEPLTGHWLNEEPTGDGNVRQIILIFKQTGTNLTGRVIFPWADMHFDDGVTDGHKFHFAVMTVVDSVRPAIYEGTLEGKEILLNREVIAIDQDPAGHQAKRTSQNGNVEVWARLLADGSQAVGLFNRGATEANVRVKWAELGITGEASVRDLWEHRTTGKMSGGYERSVASHGVVLLKIAGPSGNAR